MDQFVGNGLGQVHVMIDLIAQLIVLAIQIFFRDIALLCPVLNDDRLFVDGRPDLHLVLEFIDDVSGVVFKVPDDLPV